MDVIPGEGDDGNAAPPVCLYTIVDVFAPSSCAEHIARRAGFFEHVLARSKLEALSGAICNASESLFCNLQSALLNTTTLYP